jgi:serine/threonine protein kinase
MSFNNAITISELALDLIQKMLDRDVQRRLDIVKVLDHDWVQCIPGPVKALSVAIRQNKVTQKSLPIQ